MSSTGDYQRLGQTEANNHAPGARPATTAGSSGRGDTATSSAAAAAAGPPTTVEEIENLHVQPVNPNDVIMSCENIHKTYLLGIEGVPALRGVSTDVCRKDFLVIFGQSGSGKTTLANTFGMIDVPTKGNLQLFDHRITERTPDEHMALLRCKKIGFVFQSFNLLSTMTAMDNVSLPMIIAGERTAEEITDRARSLLVSVGLGHRLQHFPGQLSGGEQQRVTIARALANEPDVLLLDEPTGDLDTKNTQLVMDILMDLNVRKGITMVMVTHDVYMKKYATRVIYFRDGRIARTEKVADDYRLESIKELKLSVLELKAEMARSGGPIGGSVHSTPSNGGDSSTSGGGTPASGGHKRIGKELIEEVRRPQDYPTYSPKASPKIFFHHDQPLLFQQLFGKTAGASLGGAEAVPVPGPRPQQQHQGDQNKAVTSAAASNSDPSPSATAATGPYKTTNSAAPAAAVGSTNVSAQSGGAANGGSSPAISQVAARHGVSLPRRGHDDGANAGEELKKQ